MLKGLLGNLFGGKKEEFFLELDESKAVQSAPSAEAKKSEPEPEVVPAATSEVATETTTEVAPQAQKTKKTSVKKAAKKTTKKETVTPATVAAEMTNGKVAKKEEPKEVEFATKYFIVPTGSRRRPGPSLNSFKTMAREVQGSRF
ncbi:MAG TPA: hypothetical protein DCF68_02150 [Cyanothece sp. UBA12306]|nr:hypothetical protein [Cyanothece sp. UBA12306]